MIYHISISAYNPKHVAEVIAQLWQGQVIPFPNHPGSYIALAFDLYGTMIEVLPKGTELRPGKTEGYVQFAEATAQQSPYSATHAAISVPLSEAEIRAIGEREGWQVNRCNRAGFFEIIEFWLENQLMLELLPPEFAARYLAFTEPHALKYTLAEMATAAP
ncbi:MAG: hypothetical protein IGS38_14095 [Synechococcales cyanobacterium M58_A2018_015]|nr:hypothetical protein [Synechococcales cyanobacterium M58_A2018_015]